ncbi:MAG: ATP-binding protein [bacterium]
MSKKSLFAQHYLEILLIAGATLCLLILSILLDLGDMLHEFLAAHEAWQADELLVATLFALLGAVFFSVRRFRDYRREIEKRLDIESQLVSHREKLNQIVAERTEELELANQNLRQSITASERASEHLKNSERRYRELFELMQEGVGMVDDQETILFCNPAYARIFEEESKDTMVGMNLKRFIPPECLEQLAAETNKRARGALSTYEIEIITAKGNRKSILVSATPKFDEDNRFLGTLGSVIDLTELKKLQDLSQRANRLEESGRVAGQVAHDFNNLLGPLIAYPELIKEMIPENDSMVQYLEAMQTSARQIAEINQQLLTLGRRAHYEQAVFNVNDLVQHALKQVGPLEGNIELITECDPDLLNVYGGSSQIARILANLVVNAVDAMPEGGRVTIKTENHYSEGLRSQFGSIGPGEYVKLTVSDTGLGMTPEVMSRMMDAFFTTKKASHRSGSGLGLSVVFAIVTDHKGCIDVQSVPGEGTSFAIYLPASREEVDVDSRQPLMRGTERILVVDDDPVQQNVASSLLNMLGYSVDTVSDGEAALVYLRDNVVDLLMVDMIMPGGLDGLDTVERVLELRTEQKIMIVSGYAESERVERALKLSSGTFVSKPFTLQTISAAVRKALGQPLAAGTIS